MSAGSSSDSTELEQHYGATTRPRHTGIAAGIGGLAFCVALVGFLIGVLASSAIRARVTNPVAFTLNQHSCWLLGWR